MFDDLNPQGFYPGENLPKLSKAEVLFFGLLMSGAIRLQPHRRRRSGLPRTPSFGFQPLPA